MRASQLNSESYFEYDHIAMYYKILSIMYTNKFINNLICFYYNILILQ